MSHAILMQAGRDPFADLESDFDGGSDEPRPAKPATEPTDFERITLGANKTTPKLARFPCRKCGGSGLYRGFQYHVGHNKCFTCKGTGLQKTDPVKNAQRAENRRKSLADLKAATVRAWREKHPEAAAWIDAKAPNFGFADGMLKALNAWGALTDRQLAAVERCIENDRAYEERKAQAAAERAAAAPSVAGAGFEKLTTAFAAAIMSGLRSPKFRVDEFQFAPAKSHSKNAGAIYVTHEGKYLGKIEQGGKFFCSRECTSQEQAEVTRIGADPLASAVMHGKKTGNCSCCGRHLENEESVELGIGPICRAKWGL